MHQILSSLHLQSGRLLLAVLDSFMMSTSFFWNDASRPSLSHLGSSRHSKPFLVLLAVPAPEWARAVWEQPQDPMLGNWAQIGALNCSAVACSRSFRMGGSCLEARSSPYVWYWAQIGVSNCSIVACSPSFRMGESCLGAGSTLSVGQSGPSVGLCWRSRRTDFW